jgi:hypothetical protein
MMKYLLPIIICGLCWADGGMWPPQGDYEIFSSDQVAIIKKTSTGEELSILVKAQWSYGDAFNGFAWIVPLPSPPQIEEVNTELFTDLAYLSTPLYTGGGCSGPFASGGDWSNNGGLGGEYHYVVSYDTIGFLDAVVIHTNVADSLTAWLNAHSYADINGAQEVFTDYIDHEWNYFFCARVDTSAEEQNQQNVGVRLTFETDQLVYPMRISSLSSSSTRYTAVYLYVIEQHKMMCDEAELEYANMVSGDELTAITRDYPALSEYIDEGVYITKLKRTYTAASDMSADIYFYQSPDDTEYQILFTGYYGSLGYTNTILAPFVLYLIYFGIKKITRRKRRY